MNPRTRLLALGGVVGPLIFVGAWSIAGASAARYSPVNGAISDLARVGASTRVAMTTGFVGFGCGAIAFGFALRDALDGRAGVAAIATGASTFGVAAFPLGGPAGDATHATFAGLGYVTLVAMQGLGAIALHRRGNARGASASIVTAATSGLCLLASTLGPAHGLWQRLGLTVGDVWIVVAASAIATARLSSPAK